MQQELAKGAPAQEELISAYEERLVKEEKNMIAKRRSMMSRDSRRFQ